MRIDELEKENKALKGEEIPPESEEMPPPEEDQPQEQIPE